MTDSQSPTTISLTRRQAMTALGVGAVALTTTHLGVAYETAQWAEQASHQQVNDLKAEIEKLEGLLALYENLEKIGIDTIISGALTAFKGFLDALRGGVNLLGEGVNITESTVSSFYNTFVTLRAKLKLVSDTMNNIVTLLKNVEDWLGQTTSPAQSLLQQVQKFFDDLLSKIPFGVGDNIRKTIDGLIGLVTALPNMVQSVQTNLVAPLHNGWFSDDRTQNVQGTLLDPITQKVLEPLKKFLADTEQALTHWESDVTTPVQNILEQRAQVRKQIAAYKQQHGLG